MVCAPVRSIIPSLKLGDYLSVQAHKPCSISHLFAVIFEEGRISKIGFRKYLISVNYKFQMHELKIHR